MGSWLQYLTKKERERRWALTMEDMQLFKRKEEIAAEIQFLQSLAKLRESKGDVKSDPNKSYEMRRD